MGRRDNAASGKRPQGGDQRALGKAQTSASKWRTTQAQHESHGFLKRGGKKEALQGGRPGAADVPDLTRLLGLVLAGCLAAVVVVAYLAARKL